MSLYFFIFFSSTPQVIEQSLFLFLRELGWWLGIGLNCEIGLNYIVVLLWPPAAAAGSPLHAFTYIHVPTLVLGWGQGSLFCDMLIAPLPNPILIHREFLLLQMREDSLWVSNGISLASKSMIWSRVSTVTEVDKVNKPQQGAVKSEISYIFAPDCFCCTTNERVEINPIRCPYVCLYNMALFGSALHSTPTSVFSLSFKGAHSFETLKLGLGNALTRKKVFFFSSRERNRPPLHVQGGEKMRTCFIYWPFPNICPLNVVMRTSCSSLGSAACFITKRLPSR